MLQEYATFISNNQDLPDVTSTYKLAFCVPMNPAEKQMAIIRNIACGYSSASSTNNVGDTFGSMLAAFSIMEEHADFTIGSRGISTPPYMTSFLKRDSQIKRRRNCRLEACEATLR